MYTRETVRKCKSYPCLYRSYSFSCINARCYVPLEGKLVPNFCRMTLQCRRRNLQNCQPYLSEKSLVATVLPTGCFQNLFFFCSHCPHRSFGIPSWRSKAKKFCGACRRARLSPANKTTAIVSSSPENRTLMRSTFFEVLMAIESTIKEKRRRNILRLLLSCVR